MITNLIFGIALVAVLVFAIKLVNGSRKKYKNMTNGEKLASTLGAKFNKLIKDLNNNIRTPEVIREQIEQLLDNYYVAKSKEFKSVLKSLNSSLQTTKSMKDDLNSKLHNMDTELTKLVQKYKETKDENDKHDSMQIMAYMESVKLGISSLETSQKELQEKYDIIARQCTEFGLKFHLKKTQIEVAITQCIANNNHNISTDLGIDDIILEYKIAVQNKGIESDVDERLSTYSGEKDKELIAPVDYGKLEEEFNKKVEEN